MDIGDYWGEIPEYIVGEKVAIDVTGNFPEDGKWYTIDTIKRIMISREGIQYEFDTAGISVWENATSGYHILEHVDDSEYTKMELEKDGYKYVQAYQIY